MAYRHHAVFFILCCLLVFVVNQIRVCSASQASLEVVSTITHDKEPLCIAVNEETNIVYVGFEGEILVINGSTKQAVTTIPYMNGNYSVLPDWIIVDVVNNQFFASGYGVNVCFFDGVTNSMIGTLSEYMPDRDEIAFDSKR
ncbi:MAG: hypothetical protein CW716_07530, partial [Candidatus Bathyarchaeum sp.]